MTKLLSKWMSEAEDQETGQVIPKNSNLGNERDMIPA